jgi:short-subunit dehydrogenase
MRATWGTALVTGASSGIGRAFAVELARRGSDLVIVARREDRLRELARELQDAHGRSVEVLPADLTDADELATVEARLADEGRPVDLLVNNAGFGTSGRFADVAVDREDQLIRVNVLAPTRLSRAALPGMEKRGHGGIVNVSSLAGEQPLPGWATYAATKSFVSNFSRALAMEMKGTGVTVMLLLPGFTRTEFQDHGDFAQRLIPGPAWMTPEEVARHALKALDKGRAEAIPGIHNRVVALATRLSPWPLTRQVLRTTTRKFW